MGVGKVETSYSSSSIERDAVAKVHGISAFGILVAAVGAQLHLKQVLQASQMWTFAQFGLVYLIDHMKESMQSKLRFSLFLGLCFSAGVNVGSWIHISLQETGYCRGNGLSILPDMDWIGKSLGSQGYLSICKPSVMNSFVLEAFILTFGTYCAIVISTVLSKSRDMLRYGSWISAGCWVLFGTYVLHYFGFIGHEMFDAIYIKLGLALFSVKVLYDTEVTMEAAKQQGSRFDVLHHAVSAVLNFLNMFIRIIKIYAEMKRDLKLDISSLTKITQGFCGDMGATTAETTGAGCSCSTPSLYDVDTYPVDGLATDYIQPHWPYGFVNSTLLFMKK